MVPPPTFFNVIQERLRPILDETRPLAERFIAAGHRLYLVGGIVRDLLADRPLASPDIDLATDARPEQTKGLLSDWADALWNQGERFGTIGAKKHDRSFEITTFRADAYTQESRKPSVEFGATIEGDLS